MELNLLERLTMADVKKNHVQHVCPLKYSQRTKTNLWDAANPPDDLLIPRCTKSFFSSRFDLKMWKPLHVAPLRLVLWLDFAKKMPEHQKKKGHKTGLDPTADRPRALNCQATSTPLLYHPFVVFLPEAPSLASICPALHRSPVGIAIYPTSIRRSYCRQFSVKVFHKRSQINLSLKQKSRVLQVLYQPL